VVLTRTGYLVKGDRRRGHEGQRSRWGGADARRRQRAMDERSVGGAGGDNFCWKYAALRLSAPSLSAAFSAANHISCMYICARK